VSRNRPQFRSLDDVRESPEDFRSATLLTLHNEITTALKAKIVMLEKDNEVLRDRIQRMLERSLKEKKA
jgi:hypothetical protein